MNAHEVASAYQPGHGHRDVYCLVRCPVHGSKGDKVEVFDKRDGSGVGAQCHSQGCDYREILDGLGVKPAEAREWVRCGVDYGGADPCKSDMGSRVAIYDHGDGTQRCVHRRPCPAHAGTGECTYPRCDGQRSKHIWGRGKPAGTLVLLWGDDDPDNYLVIAEGEKAAAALLAHGANDAGVTPVTWRGGAGKEGAADWSPVSGRDVVGWPDRDDDDQGLGAMTKALEMADDAGATSLHMVDISGMPELDGADAADVDSETALRLIMDAPPFKRDAAVATAVKNPPAKPKPKEAADAQVTDFGPVADLDFKSPRSFSSTANAVRLLLLCPEQLMVALDEDELATLYVCDEKTGIWSRSAVAIGAAIERSLERWQRSMVGELMGLTQKQRDRISDWIARTRSPVGHQALVKSLPAALGMLREYEKLDGLLKKGLVVCDAGDVDAQMTFLGNKNGVADLDTGQLLPPAEGRTKLVSQSTRIAFHPMAHADQTAAALAVEELLEYLSEAERGWIEGVLGYALRGSPDGWAWLVGPTKSGKTTLLEAVVAALGDYAFAIPAKMLDAKALADHSEGMHLFTMGKRLAIASDILGNVNIDAPLVKGLATGDMKNERRIRGALEGQGSRVTATMVLAFNEGQTPRIPLTDEAFIERLRLLKYPGIPKERRKPKSYRDNFLSDTSLKQTVLAWLVDAAMRHPQLPADIPGGEIMLEEMRRSVVGEEVHDFLTDRLLRTRDPADRLQTGELWAEAVAVGGNPEQTEAFGLTRRRFSNTVRRVFSLPPSTRMRFGKELQQAWAGIRWRDPDDEDQEKQGGLL